MHHSIPLVKILKWIFLHPENTKAKNLDLTMVYNPCSIPCPLSPKSALFTLFLPILCQLILLNHIGLLQTYSVVIPSVVLFLHIPQIHFPTSFRFLLKCCISVVSFFMDNIYNIAALPCQFLFHLPSLFFPCHLPPYTERKSE